MKNFNAPRRTVSNGFTLIELLVVIAIMSLLAAIMFPAFERVREGARRSSCQNHFKQIGLSFAQYAQDYDEKLPYQAIEYVQPYATSSTTNWITGLQPYLKNWQVFRCPSALPSTSFSVPTGNSDCSDMHNGVVAGRSTADIPDASGIIVIQEYLLANARAWDRPYKNVTGIGPGTYLNWMTDTGFNNMHLAGGNLLFCDGHVKWQNYTTITSAQYGLGGNHTGVVPVGTSATSLF